MRGSTIKKFFILILLSISFSVYAGDKGKKGQEEEIFNENLPAKISTANAEFIYKFLLAEIATQRGDLN